MKRAASRRGAESFSENGGPAGSAADHPGDSFPHGAADAKESPRIPAASTVTPDDFAAALQRTVDDLQTRLTSLTNPITNFAVKEFRVEAPVIFSVSKLGAALYRFLSPGENVEPGFITRISLTLVPIEKQSSAGTLPASLFKPETRIEELSGVDAATVQILRQQKIYTVGDIWRVGARANARVELESLLKMSREKLSNLLAEAELLLVRGIGAAEAQVLFKMGIRSIADLSKVKPDELARKFNQSAGRTGLQLSAGVAEAWVRSARSYVGAAKDVVEERPTDSSA